MRIIVIGAGVLGVTTAWYLARDGHEVTVLDQAARPGEETSFANGGLLHASHAEPWNAPGVVWQLLRWIGREDSPLLLRPGQIPRLVGWGLGFLRNSTTARFERHTAVNAALAVYSLQQLQELRRSTGIHYDEAQHGILKIFHDQQAMDGTRHSSELMAPLGVRHSVLDSRQTIALEPSLEESREQILGGIYYPDDESGDARLFTERLAALAEHEGVGFRFGTTVKNIEVRNGRWRAVEIEHERLEADACVIAAGNGAKALAAQAGMRLPIYPVKGYSVTLPLQGWRNPPTIPLIDDARKVVITLLGDRIRLAGTAEFAGYDTSLHTRRAATVLRQAASVYPSLGEHAEQCEPAYWTGLRPMTMDGPPILGPSPVDGLYLNAGPGHLGWTFACGCSRIVADVVSGREPALNLDGMDLQRFRR
ncbi:D-amino acid dehydrogenase [Aquisalimonas sp. 2447]|uniref:D-amino acid dehydrogenase n=1 Tax=Aquisalimonas sp. 2447 TaxID=2740807 RepID=UPI00143276A9|nr:D-amino acid dehydrogenase [Aquisalimonas sp. 2447]QIT56360.1 D-amino acid dehydrogenase [Aquisalimonas sp. 2447]